MIASIFFMRKCLSASPFKAGSCPLAAQYARCMPVFLQNDCQAAKFLAVEGRGLLCIPLPPGNLPIFYEFSAGVAGFEMIVAPSEAMQHVI
ncbi:MULTISPECIES: hypothetical protein [unclassified Ensifer]|uniref:hypothetical protein n=1 Tax=unclassified Ensifer TaxID=2633371 RepID=UPI0011465098|nr:MULTISPECIES: hypothetical protein [unclassified Ensifer]